MLRSIVEVGRNRVQRTRQGLLPNTSLAGPGDHGSALKKSVREPADLTVARNGWLSREDFVPTLRKERHRTDRTGSPFCLLVFELRENLGHDGFHKELKRILSTHTRDYDVRVLLDPHRLGVLLLDTPVTQARVLAAKMLGRLRERAKGTELTAFLRAVRVCAYPASDTRGYERLELQLDEARASWERRRTQTSCAPVELFSGHSSEPLVWNVSCDPLGTAVLETPLFLDLHLCSEAGYRVAKRVLDILGAAIGLVVTAPLWLVIAALVKLTSKGPVLFRQERVGYRGRHFTMLKFRTMKVGCDDAVHREYVKKLIEGRNGEVNLGTEEQPVYKIVNDPRVTSIGRLLRRTSLDELPQLINVLLGQMSLVGPRPPLPFEVESYKSWHLRRILETKPGITGLWQVYGRSSTSFDEMVRMDLQYAAKRSLWLDVRLILKTFAAVLTTKGAL